MEIAGQPGSYVTVDREWTSGDVVEVRVPMSLRVEAMPDDPSTIAVLYGPVLLAGALGQEGLDRTVNICRRYEIPVYVVGIPAPFGKRETLVKWVDPDPKYDQTPQWGEVNQGPESFLPERLKLGFLSGDRAGGVRPLDLDDTPDLQRGKELLTGDDLLEGVLEHHAHAAQIARYIRDNQD